MSAYLPAKRTTILDVRQLLRPSWKSATALLCVGAFAWTALIALPARLGANATLLRMRPITDERAEVVLNSARAERKYEYVSVAGSLANVSARDLRNVEAVVELLDGQGDVLHVESALIGAANLAPNAECSFAVTMRDAEGSAAYRVRFRTLVGSSIPSRGR